MSFLLKALLIEISCMALYVIISSIHEKYRLRYGKEAYLNKMFSSLENVLCIFVYVMMVICSLYILFECIFEMCKF